MAHPKFFKYYKVTYKLLTEMLGTCSEASIWNVHVIKKAMKQIKKANQLTGKLNKIAEQFIGDEISPEKHIAELQGIINAFSELIGEHVKDMPNDVAKLLGLAEEIENKYREILKSGEESPATVFMREPDGNGGTRVKIGSHMALGNLKKNASVMVNNGDKSILNTKVSVGEVFALDVKPIDQFMYPDQDIIRDENGKRVLCERPVRFNRMGKDETAISQSEQLPIGTEFGCILRVRAESPITKDALIKLLTMGRSNGLGAWRSSGGKGQYCFKLEELEDFTEDGVVIPEGFM